VQLLLHRGLRAGKDASPAGALRRPLAGHHCAPGPAVSAPGVQCAVRQCGSDGSGGLSPAPEQSATAIAGQ